MKWASVASLDGGEKHSSPGDAAGGTQPGEPV